MFPKNSPFVESVNNYLGIFLQAGLIKHWIAETDYIFELDSLIHEIGAHRKIILNVMQLFFAFILLFVGCGISTIFFIFEIIVRRV